MQGPNEIFIRGGFPILQYYSSPIFVLSAFCAMEMLQNLLMSGTYMSGTSCIIFELKFNTKFDNFKTFIFHGWSKYFIFFCVTFSVPICEINSGSPTDRTFQQKFYPNRLVGVLATSAFNK